MLTVTTTHLENYLRRNGVPRCSKATFTEHWVLHGNYLTIYVVYDLVILTEPLVRSQSWFLDPGQRAGLFRASIFPEVPAAEGIVPHHLPGTNPWLKEYAEGTRFHSTPPRGGAETLYPEHARRWGPTNPRTSANASVTARASAIALSDWRPMRTHPAPRGLRGRRHCWRLRSHCVWALSPRKARRRVTRQCRFAQRQVPRQPTSRFCPCRRTSICWRVAPATPPCRSETMACCSWTLAVRSDGAEAVRGDPDPHEQADSHHHQHTPPQRPHRWQPGAREAPARADRRHRA